MYAQDLHVHSEFSEGDPAWVPQQTVEFVKSVGHARILGISDHIDLVGLVNYPAYREAVRAQGLYLGIEVGGAGWVEEALEMDVDYYLYECPDRPDDYAGAERLLATGKPVVIAHPLMRGTDFDRLPPQCLVEINNNYVWRYDWRALLAPHVSRFGFVIGSDAHRPTMLNQTVARYVAAQLGIREVVLFRDG